MDRFVLRLDECGDRARGQDRVGVTVRELPGVFLPSEDQGRPKRARSQTVAPANRASVRSIWTT